METKSLNTSEVITSLKSNDISVVKIDYLNSESTATIEGNLGSFIDSIKAMNQDVIFLQEVIQEAEDFFYKPKHPSLETDELIDLCEFSDELEEFKKFNGKTICLIFSAFYKNEVFSFYHHSDWSKDFYKVLESAKTKLSEYQNSKFEELELEQETKEQKLIELLESLVDDEKFASLRTHKMKKEYALQKYPKLKEMSERKLLEEISNIDAKIKVSKVVAKH